MAIRCTSTAANDVELFADINELETDLLRSASGEYMQSVLEAMRTGVTPFQIANGPATDTYELI